MKNVNLYRKILRGFIFLGIVYIIYSIIYYFVSADKLKDRQEKGTFKIGKLLNVSEDRINYLGDNNFKGSYFSTEAIIDNKYYVIILKLGFSSNKNKSISDIVTISSIPFSKENEESYLTRNDFIIQHPKSIHCPYSLVFNTRVFPVEIRSIMVYTEQTIEVNNKMKNENMLELNVNSQNISFSFNGLGEEDMLLSSFEGHKANILIYRDMLGYVYVISFSSKLDIVDGKLKFLAPPIKMEEL